MSGSAPAREHGRPPSLARDGITPPSSSSSLAARHRRGLRSRISAPCRQSVFSKEMWHRLARSLGLSKREAQIVPALFDDEKESAIAKHLGISRHTVHTYTARLYRKMGVTSRVGLARRIFVEYMWLVGGVSRGSSARARESLRQPTP